MFYIFTTVFRVLITTNSIPQHKNLEKCNKLKVVSVAPLFAKAITLIFTTNSVGSLFKVKSLSSLPETYVFDEIV